MDEDWVRDVVIKMKTGGMVGEHIVEEVNVAGGDLT